MTTKNRLVTAGKTADTWERPELRHEGPATQHEASVREQLQAATDNLQDKHPQGPPRGGEDEGPNWTDSQTTTRLRIRNMIGTTETTVLCQCGKPCKNLRGLRIHQAKSKCQPAKKVVERAVPTGETVENHSQESNHSTEDLLSTASSQESRETEQVGAAPTQAHLAEKTQKINWPPSNSTEWSEFDNDLDNILETALTGKVERKIESFGKLVYAVAKERFGVLKEKGKKEATPNRREQKISGVRKELRSLRKRFRLSTPEEKDGLAQLRSELRSQLKSLRNAERIRKAGKEREKRRASFVANPFRFAATVLEGKRSGKLTCERQQVEDYLKVTHSDEHRNVPLGENHRIEPVKTPEKPFDIKEPTMKEVGDVVKKARAKSAPGPNGVTYKVYKKCPKLLQRLHRLIKVVWRKVVVPACWQLAEGCFVPKEEQSSLLGQFRTISLLNVEGKIFFAILAKRLTTYMLNNDYIDTSVQKGGVPGFPGCIEHTSVISQLIRDAKINRSDLTVVWLDLANAYGTVPHKLIAVALDHYHVPETIQRLITTYLEGIYIRFTVQEYTTSWQKLEKGIVTGCTISVVLFIMAMNLIIEAGQRETRGPLSNTNIRQPPSRGFMDDLTITTPSIIQARWILTALGDTVAWARMKFKPAKSRCMILKKGQITSKFHLYVQDEEIPSIVGNPVKCLGKWYDDSLTDKKNSIRLQQQATEGLKGIDKSGLPGKFKAWLFQYGLLPRLAWPLMLYEVSLTTVESIERSVNKHLRRWLGVPPCFSSVGLYSKTAKLQLPLTSVVEEFKTGKARLVMTLKDSNDSHVRKAGVEVRTGRKWSAAKAVDEAESRLRHKDIVGAVCIGRQGLGTAHTPRWRGADAAERRQLVQKDVRQREEESRHVRAVEMGKQGEWTKWDTEQRKLPWNQIWSATPWQLKFLLRSVYDVLPTPTNLCTWGLSAEPNCHMCSKPANLEHILSSCRVSLTQGRYRWRHDQVLKALAHVIDLKRREKKRAYIGHTQIQFVKAGGTIPHKPKSTRQGILDDAADWELMVDLGKKLVFPSIVETLLRPDIILVSKSKRKLIAVELTVPWETRCQQAHERKLAKYQELLNECRQKGWQTWNLPVEIGCRGFPASSCWKTLGILGIVGCGRKKAVDQLGREAEKASRWLWIRRESSWMPTTESGV